MWTWRQKERLRWRVCSYGLWCRLSSFPSLDGVQLIWKACWRTGLQSWSLWSAACLSNLTMDSSGCPRKVRPCIWHTDCGISSQRWLQTFSHWHRTGCFCVASCWCRDGPVSVPLETLSPWSREESQTSLWPRRALSADDATRQSSWHSVLRRLNGLFQEFLSDRVN